MSPDDNEFDQLRAAVLQTRRIAALHSAAVAVGNAPIRDVLECAKAFDDWLREELPVPVVEAHLRGALNIVRGVGYGEMPEDRILHRDTLNELELHLQKALSEVTE